MSFVIAAPEALVAVASDLAGIGSALAEANAAALAPTTALLAAGADEVFGGDRGAVWRARAGVSDG
ncbi:hypothetical protein IQ40_13750 [Mycobacterium tuberculosis]|nr:hypothetical protein IQ47_13700 [Mycobacterium tuberculosis]AIH46275.1 hypothetical protein IQ40_13750 [Mycobacterium tuberculosis]